MNIDVSMSAIISVSSVHITVSFLNYILFILCFLQYLVLAAPHKGVLQETPEKLPKMCEAFASYPSLSNS